MGKGGHGKVNFHRKPFAGEGPFIKPVAEPDPMARPRNKSDISFPRKEHPAPNPTLIRQYKEMIGALRAQLETQAEEREHVIQQAVASAQDEIVQLRQTIIQLREHLEFQEYENTKAVQEAKLTNLDEIQQLKQNIGELRTTLETQTLMHQQKEEELTRSSRNEIHQLHQTIMTLRTELEAHTKKGKPHG
jgi:HAMP domain-containing protein